MKFQETDSGLMVPATPPPEEEPSRKLGLLEIRDDDRRQQASDTLTRLWYVLDLSRGGDGLLEERPGTYDAHFKMWEHMAESLLGPDAPYQEALT